MDSQEIQNISHEKLLYTFAIVEILISFIAEIFGE